MKILRSIKSIYGNQIKKIEQLDCLRFFAVSQLDAAGTVHRDELGWGWELFSIVDWNKNFEQSEQPINDPSIYLMN